MNLNNYAINEFYKYVLGTNNLIEEFFYIDEKELLNFGLNYNRHIKALIGGKPVVGLMLFIESEKIKAYEITIFNKIETYKKDFCFLYENKRIPFLEIEKTKPINYFDFILKDYKNDIYLLSKDGEIILDKLNKFIKYKKKERKNELDVQ